MKIGKTFTYFFLYFYPCKNQNNKYNLLCLFKEKWKGNIEKMIDNYYNSMIENLLPRLKNMVSVNEPGTMDQYKTMNLKEWNRFKEVVDSVKEYVPSDGKRNQIMTYYNETVYPLLDSGRLMKQGFHKYQAIRIDDFDFRQMLNKLETLMTSQK